MKSNLDPKIESALCYLPFIGWIAAIIFLIIEKSADVRFNAAQGLVLMVGVWLLMFLLGVTIVLAILVPLVWIAVLVLQIVLAVKAYQGKKMVLPVVGPLAEKLLAMVSAK